MFKNLKELYRNDVQQMAFVTHTAEECRMGSPNSQYKRFVHSRDNSKSTIESTEIQSAQSLKILAPKQLTDQSTRLRDNVAQLEKPLRNPSLLHAQMLFGEELVAVFFCVYGKVFLSQQTSRSFLIGLNFLIIIIHRQLTVNINHFGRH